MLRRPPGSTRTYTLFPYTTLFRSTVFSVADVDMPETQNARGRGGLYTNGHAKARRALRSALNPNFTASAVSGPRGWDYSYDIDAEAIRPQRGRQARNHHRRPRRCRDPAGRWAGPLRVPDAGRSEAEG